MIAGFRKSTVCCNGVVLSVHRAGQGEPLLLLHGFPQNHMCWERVAPQLARHYDVIIPDLRGYGESEAPPNESGNVTYSKRTMAQDIADLLTALAVQRANVLGHDRGARVAYRFALDHPERINKLGIIEIVPTADFWASWTADLAIAAYHWTFLAQPAPLPEQMIGADPVAYLDWTLAQWTLSKSLDTFTGCFSELPSRFKTLHGFTLCVQTTGLGRVLTESWMRKTRSLANRLSLHYGYSVVPMVFQLKAVMLLRFGVVGHNVWRRVFAMLAIL